MTMITLRLVSSKYKDAYSPFIPCDNTAHERLVRAPLRAYACAVVTFAQQFAAAVRALAVGRSADMNSWKESMLWLLFFTLLTVPVVQGEHASISIVVVVTPLFACRGSMFSAVRAGPRSLGAPAGGPVPAGLRDVGLLLPGERLGRHGGDRPLQRARILSRNQQ